MCLSSCIYDHILKARMFGRLLLIFEYQCFDLMCMHNHMLSAEFKFVHLFISILTKKIENKNKTKLDFLTGFVKCEKVNWLIVLIYCYNIVIISFNMKLAITIFNHYTFR